MAKAELPPPEPNHVLLLDHLGRKTVLPRLEDGRVGVARLLHAKEELGAVVRPERVVLWCRLAREGRDARELLSGGSGGLAALLRCEGLARRGEGRGGEEGTYDDPVGEENGPGVARRLGRVKGGARDGLLGDRDLLLGLRCTRGEEGTKGGFSSRVLVVIAARQRRGPGG